MERIRAASLGDVAEGTGRLVEVAGRRIALFRDGGEVLALDDCCSHGEASLSGGEVDDGTVECPRHGAVFDLRSGEALSLPATHGVAVYRAEVEGDDVYVWAEPTKEGMA
jgi:3-phenylpropionate/trans-cinnamate dioxygenase ferredoxin subunit